MQAAQAAAAATRPVVAPPVVMAEAAESPAEAVTLEDDMAPLWPDEAAEAAYLAEARPQEEVPSSSAPIAEAEEAADKGAALPELDQLVQRIPPAVRETLEEYFRARFVKVKRTPKAVLKESNRPG